MKGKRITYSVAAVFLLLVEIYIGLYVHGNFVRSYLGDVLVTILLCCLLRIIFPTGIRALPIYVFVFSVLVETAQYFDIVKILGLESNQFISTLVGRWFSFIDIICYAAGCFLFWFTEMAVNWYIKRRRSVL